MTENELSDFKIKLISFCGAQLERRIHQCQSQMQKAQQAANEEEKSSAGDKYETSRAMNQLNKDMFARQLADNQQELSAFLSAIKQPVSDGIKVGHLIDCDQMFFFIAVGLGKLEFENRTVIFLSPAAPLTRNFLGKKQGDFVNFNNHTLQIRRIS